MRNKLEEKILVKEARNSDGKQKVFWIHPALREYRLPLFELMSRENDLFFLFMMHTNCINPFNSYTSVPIRKSAKGGFLEPWKVRPADRKVIKRQVEMSDVVISSFIRNAYTYTALYYAKKYNKPMVVWEEWNRINKSRIKYYIRDMLFIKLISTVDSVFTLGPRQQALLVEHGYPMERITQANEYPDVIYSKLNGKYIKTHMTESKYNILYIGRLIECKGVEYIIDAMADNEIRSMDITLTIVGDGPLRSTLEKCVLRNKLTNVQFLGAINDIHEKAYLFDQSDLVIVPSIRTGKKTDPGPLVTLEALSAGKPLIISEAVGNSHHVIEGVTGYIIKQRSSECIAEAIKKCHRGEIGTMKEIEAQFHQIEGHEKQYEMLKSAIQIAKMCHGK